MSNGLYALIRATIRSYPQRTYTTLEIYERVKDLSVTLKQVIMIIGKFRSSKSYRHLAVDTGLKMGKWHIWLKKDWIRKEKPHGGTRNL